MSDPSSCGGPRKFSISWSGSVALTFTWAEVVAVSAPHPVHATLQAALEAQRAEAGKPPAILDPVWGLERMIAALA
jgi:hypothetical protein